MADCAVVYLYASSSCAVPRGSFVSRSPGCTHCTYSTRAVVRSPLVLFVSYPNTQTQHGDQGDGVENYAAARLGQTRYWLTVCSTALKRRWGEEESMRIVEKHRARSVFSVLEGGTVPWRICCSFWTSKRNTIGNPCIAAEDARHRSQERNPSCCPTQGCPSSILRGTTLLGPAGCCASPSCSWIYPSGGGSQR